MPKILNMPHNTVQMLLLQSVGTDTVNSLLDGHVTERGSVQGKTPIPMEFCYLHTEEGKKKGANVTSSVKNNKSASIMLSNTCNFLYPTSCTQLEKTTEMSKHSFFLF